MGLTVIEVDEMICIDSSGDWERASTFRKFLGLSLESRTYGAAAIVILG